MAATQPQRIRLLMLVVAGAAALLAASILAPKWSFERQTQFWLAQPAIDPDSASNLLQHRLASPAVWRRFWNTGKLPHRRAIAHAIAHAVAAPTLNSAALAQLRLDLFLEAAADPDFTVRDRFFSTLTPQDLPRLLPALQAQLANPDPEFRQLGIKTLRRAASRSYASLLVPMLLDPDPAVALAADAALRNWTGQDTGLRLHLALKNNNDDPAARPLSLAHRLQLAHAFWVSWVRSNPSETPPSANAAPPLPTALRPAPDFELRSLAGPRVKLSQFRGKVVLIHFWTTWCPACLREFPHLAELQQRLSNECEIIGINLDSLAPPASHLPSEASSNSPLAHPSLKSLTTAVGSTAARHRLTHTLLLDPEQSVSSLFDGHELPTFVVVDPDGKLRLRVVGGRSADAWEKIIRAAAVRPPDSR